ncbi:MAG TPA: HD domain-containing protein, partial [Thermoanaerobaculia bacterium]|nr:HD domain-containing protein [Thermoanaerobaculia bacterium]
DFTDRLLALSARRRAALAGLNPERADILVAGALVYRWLLQAAGRDGLYVSGQGLREGVFYRRFLPAPHQLEDVRAFAVANLASRFSLATAHTRHVRELAGQLFTGLAPIHGLGPREAELLAAAAALHDIGITVGFYRHHRHGGYILEADALPGFSHREHALLIELIRFHHKGIPRLDRFRPLTLASDKEMLGRLATCLRLAESLERSRAQRIRSVRVELDERTVRLRLEAREEPAVEIWEAEQHAGLVRRAFGRKLVIESGG